MAVVSDGKHYSVPPGLVFSFPCVCDAGKWTVVEDLYLDERSRELIHKNVVELENEYTAAQAILAPQTSN